MSVWVTVDKAGEMLGLTRLAIYARIKRRQWQSGKHWVKQGGRLFIDITAIYAWIEQAKSV